MKGEQLSFGPNADFPPEGQLKGKPVEVPDFGEQPVRAYRVEEDEERRELLERREGVLADQAGFTPRMAREAVSPPAATPPKSVERPRMRRKKDGTVDRRYLSTAAKAIADKKPFHPWD